MNHRAGTGTRSRLSLLVLASGLLAGGACTELTALKQDNPGQLSAATIYTPGNAQLLVNGAIADFECAFARYVVGTGLFTDELANAIAATANYDYDRRTLASNAPYGTATCGNNQQPPIYTTLSTARAAADTIAAKLRGWTDAEMPRGVNRMQLIGQSAAYAGYSLILLGEAMCSGAINLSPELTPAQLFAEAKARFDSAVVAATAAGDARTRDLALLGRARSLLNLGNAAAAGADAALIPAGFLVATSTDAVAVRLQNTVFVSIINGNWNTVDPSFRGLTVDGVPDPRVRVTNTGRTGTAAGTQIWTADKYPAITTPMPIARYAEAQLIVAEAALTAGDLAGAAAAINRVRAAWPGLPAYSVAGKTAADVRADLIEERRRELFLEGHRLGDIRRYGVPIMPAEGTPFPGGGGTYGSQSCFPLPDVERVNNPNIGD